jgi:hypothetical protein
LKRSVDQPGAFSFNLKDASKISNSGSSSAPFHHRTLIMCMRFIFASPFLNRTERENLACLTTLLRIFLTGKFSRNYIRAVTRIHSYVGSFRHTLIGQKNQNKTLHWLLLAGSPLSYRAQLGPTVGSYRALVTATTLNYKMWGRR